MSSKHLTDSETAVLAKGLNFAPAPASIPTKRIVANVEYALRGIPQPVADATRLKITTLLRDAKLPARNLTPDESKALKTLKSSQNVIILPADKGRATVVLDRKDYDSKLSALLSDDKTYWNLRKDPAPALERRMNSHLLALNKSGSSPDALYERLRSSSGRLPLPSHRCSNPRPDVAILQQNGTHLQTRELTSSANKSVAYVPGKW